MIPNYELTTDGEIDNVYETSFVENPATGKSFLKFNDDMSKINKTLKSELMEFKTMINFNSQDGIDLRSEYVCSGV
jgi:hypothetical protein